MNTSKRYYTIDDLEELLDNLPYEIWLKDKDGKHLYVNKLCAEKIGMSKENIIGKTNFELRDYEIAKSCKQTDSKLVKLTKKGIKSIKHEEVFFKDGQNINYSIQKFIINNNKKREEIYGGTAIETTYNKNTEEEMENIISKYFTESNINQSYKDIFSDILESIKSFIKCDKIEIFKYDKNRNLFELYNGYFENDTSNNNVIEIDEEFGSIISTPINSVELENKLKEEIKMSTYNKKECNGLCDIQLIKFGKEIVGLARVTYDKPGKNRNIRDYEFLNEMYKKIFIATQYSNNIDKLYKQDFEKKYIKESLEVEKMKDDFFSNISHEFRTPLNMIISIIQLMLKKIEINEINEECMKRNLKILRQNSYRLLRLINNVIDTVKIRNDFYDMRMKNKNIVEVVEEIVQSTVEYVESKNRSIVFDTSEEEIILAFDDEKIERIILNLISNAIKFSKINTPIEVKVSRESLQEDDKVFISVRNHSETRINEYNDKIFTKFTQGEELYTRKNEGSGIGLFIVKRMVEAHNGSIWFSNIDEDIVEFKFYIPIKQTEESYVYEEMLDKSYRVERCNIEFSDIYD